MELPLLLDLHGLDGWWRRRLEEGGEDLPVEKLQHHELQQRFREAAGKRLSQPQPSTSWAAIKKLPTEKSSMS